jgi:hypothetical protein
MRSRGTPGKKPYQLSGAAAGNSWSGAAQQAVMRAGSAPTLSTDIGNSPLAVMRLPMGGHEISPCMNRSTPAEAGEPRDGESVRRSWRCPRLRVVGLAGARGSDHGARRGGFIRGCVVPAGSRPGSMITDVTGTSVPDPVEDSAAEREAPESASVVEKAELGSLARGRSTKAASERYGEPEHDDRQ